MPHIASTLTNATRYTEWNRGGDGRLIEGRSVVIKGGFGLADKNFVTPTGAILTSISDDELAFLESDHHFKEHLKNGFLKIYKKGAVPGEKAADGMQLGDKSQPLNPMQFQDNDPNKPETLSVSTGSVSV
ncbi:hypothetical protein RHSP_32011 [Rhizobium freirei PRF 81]|uniref:Uncharacterized protein n=1 Tax=Rhizobium freirei PRF 81 TaxID=363754 RepID=N6V503_9HYPH|nr:hypothetical protein [Rhizobium freirei]ENN86067.1 hypothetical protein RHSP_32011 [Rhizobium freirei PRF 81]